ncbi:type II toxin-antitoxin system Phd/YefM family antitoxin [Clostridium sp. AM58-1XD]|uniref:type II toxin-antitoxin system Phd/YefM family antitoxin n=1 Tax=Clostridium sp. AM58-1XD TaxID=2292307 RepID=UPI000E4B6D98|nr:type II toxin-antitoxin system Phd/YefM family antitoxin [Clostridium sp. AM58-1XD]RGY95492.1 type II toxin-antitoxin system Phd/YefM family antitoxin [Clostridium sp. AM58-1XD]
MPNIIPITELRKTNEISDLCHKSQEPVFVTKNGYGDLVVMSMEAYEKLVYDKRIDSAVAEAEQEVQAGTELIDAREALAGLRRKYAK